jgi:hypothetical protein
LPCEWNNTLYSVEGGAPAESNFLASRLREQVRADALIHAFPPIKLQLLICEPEFCARRRADSSIQGFAPGTPTHGDSRAYCCGAPCTKRRPCDEDACPQLHGGGPSVAGGANGAVGALFESGGNAAAPGGVDASDEGDETDDAAAATGYEPHAVVLPAVVAPASSPPSQSQPKPASAPVGVELYGGGGHVMSCMGEILEGQIWHAKLLSIETGR